MKTHFKWLDLISWLMPVTIMLIASGLDRWQETLNKTASAISNAAPAVWGALAANLVVAALMLFLTWLVAVRRGRSRFLAGFCLIVGVLAAIYPWWFEISHMSSFPRWPPLRMLRIFLRGVGPVSRPALASSFLLLIGLLGLLFPERQGPVVTDT